MIPSPEIPQSKPIASYDYNPITPSGLGNGEFDITNLSPEDMLIEVRMDAKMLASRIPTAEFIEQAKQNDLPELLDKESWHNKVKYDIDEAYRRNLPLSVAYIDLNYFKEVNDTLGHHRGDVVIEEVKRVIGSALRTNNNRERSDNDIPTDTVSFGETESNAHIAGIDVASNAGHIGGDEFAIEAWTNEEGMQIMIDRVRAAFDVYLNLPENKDLKSLGMMGRGINMSIGSATLKFGMKPEDLLKAADQAMYADKISQLPEINRRQRLCVNAAKLMLRLAHVRLRDVGKVEQAMIAQKAAKKQAKTIARAA